MRHRRTTSKTWILLLFAAVVCSLGGFGSLLADMTNHGVRDEQMSGRGHGESKVLHQQRISTSHYRLQKNVGGGGGNLSQAGVSSLLAHLAATQTDNHLPAILENQSLPQPKLWLLLCSLLI